MNVTLLLFIGEGSHFQVNLLGASRLQRLAASGGAVRFHFPYESNRSLTRLFARASSEQSLTRAK